MNRAHAILFVTLAAVSAARLVWAETKPSVQWQESRQKVQQQEPRQGRMPARQQASPADNRLVTGRVASIHPKERALALKTGLFSTQRFAVDLGTQIREGNRTLRLSDLNEGDQVEIQYMSRNGKQVAERVSIVRRTSPGEAGKV